MESTLTAEKVRQKKGRPLLDHVLRPRFSGGDFGYSVGLQTVDLQKPSRRLAKHLLSLGADPNEEFEGSSIFALFLSLMVYIHEGLDDDGQTFPGCLPSLKAIVEGGFSLRLPVNQLRTYGPHELNESSDRWLQSILLSRRDDVGDSEGHVDLLDILERIRSIFGSGIDKSIALVRQRAALEGQDGK